MKTLIKYTFSIVALLLFTQLSAQTWVNTSSNPNEGRVYFSTVQMNDGRVVFVGGVNDSGLVNYVDIYNPILDTWFMGANFPVPVQDAAAVCVSDSIVLLFGGRAENETVDNVWEYNVNTDTWTAKEGMPIDIREHNAIVLQNNKVLITGGYRQPSDTDNPWSFVYDPITDSYSDPINLVQVISGHSSFLLDNGNVLIIGGVNGYIPSNIGQIYDVDTDTWSSTTSPTTRSGGQSGVKLSNGNVVVVGGYNYQGGLYLTDVDVFDVDTETWSALANLPQGKTRTSVSELSNGNIMVAGGFDASKSNIFDNSYNGRKGLKFGKSNNTKICYDNVINIDYTSGVITAQDPLLNARTSMTTIVLRDNRIALFFGNDGTNYYHNGTIYGTASAANLFDIIFHVTETDGTTPIDGAEVTFNSEALATSISGDASFSNVEAGNGLYYTVLKDGYDAYEGYLSVQNSNFEVNVLLQQTQIGIGDIASNNIANIYPNPSSGEFHIQSKHVKSIEVTSICGQIVYVHKNLDESKTIFDISIEDAVAGIYSLSIETETGIYNKKLIIK